VRLIESEEFAKHARLAREPSGGNTSYSSVERGNIRIENGPAALGSSSSRRQLQTLRGRPT